MKHDRERDRGLRAANGVDRPSLGFALAAVLAACVACASLWSAAEPAGRALLRAAVNHAIRLAEKKVGHDLEDVPATCEVEHHPGTKQVLVLCTICYQDPPVKNCR